MAVKILRKKNRKVVTELPRFDDHKPAVQFKSEAAKTGHKRWIASARERQRLLERIDDPKMRRAVIANKRLVD